MFLCSPSVHSQRLEVHAIKDFSTDANANKAWGIGGGIDLDQLVNKMAIKGYFDWAVFKEKNNPSNTNYQKMGGGIAVCYSINIKEKISFQCGAEVNYTHLKHTYIYADQQIDSIMSKPLTVLQRGNYIGIGAHIGLLYKLTPRFSIVLNVVPTNLLSVGGKSSVSTVKPEYNKGIWLFSIRLGILYQLFKND